MPFMILIRWSRIRAAAFRLSRASLDVVQKLENGTDGLGLQSNPLSYSASTFRNMLFRPNEIKRKSIDILKRQLRARLGRRGHIAFENGLWILRDGLNEIYDIH
jgi:hypothetical protein